MRFCSPTSPSTMEISVVLCLRRSSSKMLPSVKCLASWTLRSRQMHAVSCASLPSSHSNLLVRQLSRTSDTRARCAHRSPIDSHRRFAPQNCPIHSLGSSRSSRSRRHVLVHKISVIVRRPASPCDKVSPKVSCRVCIILSTAAYAQPVGCVPSLTNRNCSLRCPGKHRSSIREVSRRGTGKSRNDIFRSELFVEGVPRPNCDGDPKSDGSRDSVSSKTLLKLV